MRPASPITASGTSSRDVHHQLELPLVRQHRDAAHGLLDDLARIELHRIERQLARLDLREVEHVVDHRQQRIRRSPQRRQILALLRRQRRVERELRHAEHAVHRRADLVAHVREELALRAARLLRARLGELQRGLRLAAHGNLVAQFARPLVEHGFEPTGLALELARRGGGAASSTPPARHSDDEQPERDASRRRTAPPRSQRPRSAARPRRDRRSPRRRIDTGPAAGSCSRRRGAIRPSTQSRSKPSSFTLNVVRAASRRPRLV